MHQAVQPDVQAADVQPDGSLRRRPGRPPPLPRLQVVHPPAPGPEDRLPAPARAVLPPARGRQHRPGRAGGQHPPAAGRGTVAAGAVPGPGRRQDPSSEGAAGQAVRRGCREAVVQFRGLLPAPLQQREGAVRREEGD